jgi:hypothetical protein
LGLPKISICSGCMCNPGSTGVAAEVDASEHQNAALFQTRFEPIDRRSDGMS